MSRQTVAMATLINGEARAGVAEGFGTEDDALALRAAIEKGRGRRHADDWLLEQLADALREYDPRIGGGER